MTKRICYIHIGPHKTGTTSIQWFLKQNRAELLKHGYFVPESEAKHGAVAVDALWNDMQRRDGWTPNV